MTRLARLTVVPLAAIAALLGAGVATATTAAPASGATTAKTYYCTTAYSYGKTRITVSCTEGAPGTMVQAVAYCPNVVHFGPWVPQGLDHVSVATCANPMAYGDYITG
jgi:hypothetical protein